MLLRLPKRYFELCAILICLLGALSVRGFAQSTRGTVTGTVQDQSGGLIVGGAVTLVSPSTGVTSNTTTNSNGIYRFEAVMVGEYVVTATAPGFGKISAPAVVTVGAVVGRDFVLKIGAVGANVEVMSQASVDLQTEDAVRSQVISSTSLADFPIPGQNSLNLILTAPGVVRSNQGGSLDSGIGAVNGGRARSNNFLLDGLQNNDISVTGPQFTITNNDELQEVSFQTTNFTAEYGRAGGAVINQVTKSGTNRIHGTVAEIYKSQLFNASNRLQRNSYNNAVVAYNAAFLVNPATAGPYPILKPKFKENIPAFTIGGPVVIPGLYNGRDHMFFFGAGQFDRFPSAAQATFTIPSAAGYATLQALAPACPTIASYLALVGAARGIGNGAVGSNIISIALPAPVANTSCSGGARTGQGVEVGQYTRTTSETVKDDNYLARLDYIVSQKQNLMLRFLYDNNVDNFGGNQGIDSRFDVPSQNKTYSLNLNHIYTLRSDLVNELRLGASRANIGFFSPNQSLAAAPDLGISGVTNLALNSVFPQGRISNNYQLQDSVTYTIGRHAIRGGIDFLRQIAAQTAPFNGRGIVTYQASVNNTSTGGAITGLANFIDDYAGPSGAASILFGSGRYHPNLFAKSGYLQDTYKASSNLTITAGLRYENFGQPANSFKYPAFVGFGDTDITSTQKVDRDNNNFGPSVGFAYSPKSVDKNSTMVIRGGYQISYDTFFNNLLSNIAGGTPNALGNIPVPSNSNGATPRGYRGLSAVLPSLVPTAITPYTADSSVFKQHIRNPYYHHFSLGIQQEMPGGVVLDIAYVGSLGRQLFYTNPLNPTLPNATFTAAATQVTPLYGVQALRLFPNRGAIQIRDSGATSNYHSLQVQVRHHPFETVAGRIYFSSSYTWSKYLDVISEVFGTNSSPQNPSRPPIFGRSQRKNDYGPSDNDRRHVFSFSGELAVRSPKSLLLNEVLGGWSISPILSIESGTPYTVTNGFDRAFDGSAAFSRPNIGNILAPVNTRGQVVNTSVCSTGLLNPALVTSTNTGCVTANDVHFVQVTTYSPSSPLMESRNSNRSTRYLDLDTNILKTFKITERVGFELRGEIFNITNNQNFDTPSSNRNVSSNNGVNFLNTFLQNGGNRSMRVGGKIKF
jgi:hypothetical protein